MTRLLPSVPTRNSNAHFHVFMCARQYERRTQTRMNAIKQVLPTTFRTVERQKEGKAYTPFPPL